MSRVVTVACLDDVAGQVVTDSLALDLPGAVVLRHTLRFADGVGGGFVRSLYGPWGLVEAAVADATSCCLTCAVREDAVATVTRLADEGRPVIVVALPPTVAPGAFVAHLAAEIELGRCHATLAAVVGAVEPTTLTADLLGDDLLHERGLALGESDRRSVGEALSEIIDYADVVAAGDLPEPAELELLRHVASPSTRLWLGFGALDGQAALALDHDLAEARRRLDPLTVDGRHVDETGQAWTIELASARPFHPQRLLDQVELLGGGRLLARGCFWLPTRPGHVCAWSGAGGHVSIGVAGEWGEEPPRTRLLVTGVDPADRDRVARAFHDCLLTRHETRQTHWPAPDGLEPWLG